MDDLIIYRCQICYKHFFLLESEVEHTEKEGRDIRCPHYSGHRGHKEISVIGKISRYGQIHKCMSHRSYVKESGIIKQRN